MAKTLKYRLIHKIRRLLGLRREDDFDWAVYDHKYTDELEDIAREHTLILEPDDYVFEAGRLRQARTDRKPLHPNARLLYETLLRLSPTSACEFGCGGGDHLRNLETLAPGLELHGLDRSRGQLALLRGRHPDLRAPVHLHNIAKPLPAALPPVDCAYTQAVLMHIHTGDAHTEGLANLFRAAQKHVVLMENWTRHPFLDDIRALEAEGRIPWDEVHVHYVESPEYDRPHMMIVSATAVPDFPVLENYATLLDPYSTPIS